MKKRLITAIAILTVLAGLGILAYPVVSNILFRNSQLELIEFYEKQVRELRPEQKSKMLDDCREYNEGLLTSRIRLTDPFDPDSFQVEDEHPYIDLLNQNGDGAMGSIDIPAINCRLIIYHSTDDESLAKGVGHLQGTSLPVGGKGSHCVLSAHTGTADKELFTNLDQLRENDVFYIRVWGDILAYKVDDRKVILPTQTDDLHIDKEHDYVTLVTCTPYGINSHRLLVRGTRIPFEQAKKLEEERNTILLDTWKSQYLYASLAGVGISAVIIVVIVLVYRRVNRKKRKTE